MRSDTFQTASKIQIQHEQPNSFNLKLLDRIAIFGTRPAFLDTLFTFFGLWWVASQLHHLGLLAPNITS